MTRIDFHFNVPDKDMYLCRLIRKIYRAKQKAVIYHPEPAILERLDDALWSFSDTDFIPHVILSDEQLQSLSELNQSQEPLEPMEPVVLVSSDLRAPHCEVLVNISNQSPSFFSRFDRLIELVHTDEKDREQARLRWRWYKERGYEINTFNVAS